MRLSFNATNNEAECEALLAGLQLAKELGAKSLLIHSDSKLVVNQVLAEYQARRVKLAAYLVAAKDLL